MKTLNKIGLALTMAILLSVFALPLSTVSAACAPTDVTLWAGQHIDAGTVSVSNDADNIYVTYSTNNPWVLTETHLDIELNYAGFPTTKSGSPKVGNFAYKMVFNPAVTEYTYVIPMDQTWWEQGTVVIAAHAVVVVYENGVLVESETGWAEGTNFGKSWATYFEYTICKDTPEPPVQEYGTETAFAYGGEYANDFLDYDFNRWGWTNGPLEAGSYEFAIYAGAGQSDITKGTLVGTLYVDYDGSTADVAYEMDEGFFLLETQLYVGNTMFPLNKGTPTVAPGQYPLVNDGLDKLSTYSYTVDGLSGSIYVIAHAVVGSYAWA